MASHTATASLTDYEADDHPYILKGISVAARRPADVGREESRIDSAGLRESVALSMADVLGYNSSIFIKNNGRATLSTATFRGTSPSHTQVTWNGMRISSPMLGSTDFSMIPSFFVDGASILHGSSSLTDVGGGLGGLVKLSTDARLRSEGFSGQYTQGVGSWRTFDEFLRLAYGRGRWQASARVAYSSSKNDFPFTNRDKKENIYDDNHQIVASYYPRERNRSSSFKDLHALATVAYDAGALGRLSLDSWYLSSNRELPLLTVDYSDATKIENRQREQTIRSVVTWDKVAHAARYTARAGYIHQWMAYDYSRQIAADITSTHTRSRSHVNTAYASLSARFYPGNQWYITADADIHHHAVRSRDYASLVTADLGYQRSRAEASAAVSARWRPSSRLGLGALVREELWGSTVSAPIPAVFAEATILPKYGLLLKASASRNYRFPTLNDLYTVPGGNPDLKPEHGFTYDASLASDFEVDEMHHFAASAGWFDSRIDDWILWLPSPKGFYIPRNVREVHSYGIESELSASLKLPRGWTAGLSAHYSWTASINQSSFVGSEEDNSVGKQLPYVPRHSASAIVRIGWRGWSVAYKWQFYSERFTMSSNETTLTGHLPAYSISGLNIEKSFTLWGLPIDAKLAVNNLFDKEYQAILSRPMPGINFEAFLSVNF